MGGVSPRTVSLRLGGLNLRRIYHYRIWASTGDGTSASADRLLAVPVLTRVKVSRGGAAVTYTDTRQALTICTVQRREDHRWVSVGHFSRRDRRVVNRARWHRGRSLARGDYRLEVTPRSASATGLTQWVRFTVRA